MPTLTWGESFVVSAMYGGLFAAILYVLEKQQMRRYRAMPPQLVCEEWDRNRSPRRLFLRYFLPAIPVLFVLLYLIPGWLGFRQGIGGCALGFVPYAIWQNRVGLKFYRSILAQANSVEMSARGQGGMRLALPHDRRLSDYTSAFWRVAPVVIWLFGTLTALMGVHLGFGRSGSIGLAYIATMAVVAIPALVFFYWFAGRAVREPIDLRSEDPERFTADVEKYLRQRGNTVLVLASANMLLLVMLELVTAFTLPVWLVWAALAFVLVAGLWSSIGGAKQLSWLEDRRWQSPGVTET